MPSPTCPCEERPKRTRPTHSRDERCRLTRASATLGGQSIREALAALGRPPRKALGQHFLAQPSIAERVAALAGVAGKNVVEIGPGLGVLTQFLLDAEHLWLIEIDPDFAERLQECLRSNERVTIVSTDALTLPWPEFLAAAAPATIVGNLPYNIATPLFERWLAAPVLPERIVAMVQHEVAERLRARPGTPGYSALSVLTQAVARVRKGFLVAPGAFVPPPKVYSQVVVVEPDTKLRQRVPDFATFRHVVRALFQQRRKQLRNGLSPLCADPTAVLAAAGLNPRCRPEELAVEDFIRLVQVLSEHAGVA